MKNKIIRKVSFGYTISAIGNSLFNASLVLMMTQNKGFDESQISLIVSVTTSGVKPLALAMGI